MFYYYSLFTSLYSTIYWAVFKQKYDVIVIESTYAVRLRIIYNGHSARLMHDHVTAISFTMITKLAHPNLCVLVWHWLLLSSESCSLCIMFSYSGSVCIHSAMRTVFLLLNTEYVDGWIRSITPDLSDNVLKKKTFVSHLFGSTVFADFYFKHCLTPNCCWY